MDKIHEICDLEFENEQMKINIDGEDYTFDLKNFSPRLLHAAQAERETFEISPSGYGINWSLLDEDISIDALLGIEHQPHQLLKTAKQA